MKGKGWRVKSRRGKRCPAPAPRRLKARAKTGRERGGGSGGEAGDDVRGEGSSAEKGERRRARGRARWKSEFGGGGLRAERMEAGAGDARGGPLS